MRKTALRTAVLIAAAALLSVPHATKPETCSDKDAARNLLAGAVADGLLNPPTQEDYEFFTGQGGYPNIYLLMDTSTSMGRLPPDGPSSLGVPSEGVVGCGAAGLGSLASSTMIDVLGARTYHSPCGATGQEGKPFGGIDPATGEVYDYAQLASKCPYFTPSSTFATGVPGYDPDFYKADSSLTVGGGRPNLFPSSLVFHDSTGEAGPWTRTGPNAGDHNFGDGWSFTEVFPYQIAVPGSGKLTTAVASVADFCRDQGTSAQDGQTREEICNECMKKDGWYYNGTIRQGTVNGISNVRYPSVWYTGNYLNFFPPKFVVARKVVKDVIANQTRIRMALAQLGPSGYLPASGAGDFNPSCSSIFNNGNWENNRTTYVNAVNALTWGGTKPLSKALFDVGFYYHTPSLPWFGYKWSLPGSLSSANSLAVCWSCQTSSIIVITDGAPPPGEGNTLPPGKSSIADSDSGKYAGDATTGILGASSADCPRCDDFTGDDLYKNNLAKVAFYLHNYDLRSEGAGSCGGNGTTLDGKGMPGKQTLDIYTVGFATGTQGDAARILSNAALAGGGLFVPADSADQLRAGVFNVFREINTRSTSFSVATVSTLQTTTGHSVIVPRFDPAREPHWPGHLYRYELYSEFVNDCTPDGAGDLDCDGACGSVFLQDKDGHFIAEDGNGQFVQTSDSLPACEQTPRCVAKGKPCGKLTNLPANPWWDAYQALQQQEWKTRAIYTVTDDHVDGRLDGEDTVIAFDASNAAKIAAYLGVGSTGKVCSIIAQKIETAGDPVTAQVVRSSKLECAKTIIRFVRGADVFNDVGRTEAEGWPPPRPYPDQPATIGDSSVEPKIPANLPKQDQLLDRKFKLGDIFHSSPVVVDPPLPADGILCPNGLHNQCMESLWRTPVKHVGGVNQYDLYAKSDRYKNRRKIILVGANDGMLHAFNGGRWHAGKDDEVTKGIDESEPPFNGYYDRGEEDGPVELWAFIPPDLLSKLSFLLTGDHQILVDGTALVRDVWVDGAPNNLSPSPDLDGMKQASEFHTVAVVGERRGGTHYFALDVTNATTMKGDDFPPEAPKFLWIYPQPDDAESFQFGETYTDFLPVPPPIGPVRIKADAAAGTYGLAAADANTPTMAVDGVTEPVPYHELWVALLPGGLDPQYLRGRGVHMVDVWTGREVFDFSYPTDLADVATNDPRRGLTFPIAATPAMVMWGKSERRPSLSWENDGYFDTATFGDLGGQLWVLRFNTPGELSSHGKVENWFGGRIFQMGYPRNDGSLCNAAGGHPFFYITANTALPGSHVYRVFAGTGDRFNLLDTNGGTCGPDNVRACAQKGCSVTLQTSENPLAATGLGSDARGLNQTGCSASAQNTFDAGQDFSGPVPTCGIEADSRLSVSCPTANVASGAATFTKDATVTCSADGDGYYGCRAARSDNRLTGVPAYGSALDLSTATTSTYPASRNWYMSLKVFDDGGARAIFHNKTQAAAYDANRYYLSDRWVSPSSWATYYSGQFSIINGASNTPGTLATATSGGWAIYYNHGSDTTVDNHTYKINTLDERTSSVSSLYGSVLWNTIQPALGEATSAITGCKQSKCTGAFRRLSYHYAADAITGAPVFRDASGNVVRSIVQNTLVPAQGDQPTVFVNQKGQIAVGQTAVNPEKGASNLGMGDVIDPVMGLGVVEVSRDLHDCRHAANGPTDLPPDPAKCR